MEFKETVTQEPTAADVFRAICGEQHVFVSEDELYLYGKDQTMDFHFPFDILLKPGSVEEISRILKYCHSKKIPVTPRGAGSGVTGGALPVEGGIVLSLERLNKILSISEQDSYIVAEAGVVTRDLCKHAEQSGYIFPVEPSSSAYSFIGGNVAENAGSINSCKYGKTNEFVLNLEVVLADGEVIWTGNNIKKSSSGLNITQLFVGSEGILGIVTKVVYRLLARPRYDILTLSAFTDLEKACKAVEDIKRSGIHPSSVELICRSALDLTTAYLGESHPLLKADTTAHLLIGLQESVSPEEYLALILSVLEKYTCDDILVGDTREERERLLYLRYNIGAAMTQNNMKYRDIDICVPFSSLRCYIEQVEEICRKEDVRLICFGHAWDGNMHTMLLIPEPEDWRDAKFERAAEQIYAYALHLGGVISGEHGIGLLQKKYMRQQYTDSQLDTMKKLKNALDPKGILNPGKLFP